MKECAGAIAGIPSRRSLCRTSCRSTSSARRCCASANARQAALPRRGAVVTDAPGDKRRRRGKVIVILDPRDPMQAARALVAARFMNDSHRLLHRHRGTFWRFQANHYALADQEAVRAEAWRFLERARRRGANGKLVPFKPNCARVSDVLDALASVCNLDSRIDPPAWLDDADDLPAATEMFPLANGLLHLPSGDLYPPTANHFGLAASEVAFDPDAPDPKHWLAFLGDLFAPDEGAITALQDWFGYALSTDTSQQKILFVVGPRRSGKGTIARVLTALVGRDSVANPTLASLQTTFGLAPLIGKPSPLSPTPAWAAAAIRPPSPSACSRSRARTRSPSTASTSPPGPAAYRRASPSSPTSCRASPTPPAPWSGG